MKLLLHLLIQVFSCVFVLCAKPQFYYPPVFWQQDNCPFKQLRQTPDVKGVTKEYFIKVLPYTGMNVVCPNEFMMNTWRERPAYDTTLSENLWHVNKAGYDKCEVNKEGKRLLVCNNPSKMKKLQFGFHPRYSREEPRFEPGKHYYFISTSNGIDLNKRGPTSNYSHCLQFHMKLHIYVCNPSIETCVWEPPQCDPPTEIQRQMLSTSNKRARPTPQQVTEPKIKTEIPTTPEAVETTTKEKPSVAPQKIEKQCSNENETSIHAVMNFVLGGVIVFLIVVVIILACALANPKRSCIPIRKKPPTAETKQTRIYESVPVQLPPNLVPIGSPQADYLVYSRARTPDPLYHAVIRTPSHNNYETPVFRYPDVPHRSRGGSVQRSRAGSTQAKPATERDDSIDNV